jgi:hypothetical protein
MHCRDYFFFTLAIIMALVLVGYVFIARAFVYRTQEHVSFDVEAIALSADMRTGVSCAPAFNKAMSSDVKQGMTEFYSLRASQSQEYLQSYLSSLRSRKSKALNQPSV